MPSRAAPKLNEVKLTHMNPEPNQPVRDGEDVEGRLASQRQALEKMSQDLLAKMEVMVAEQEERVRDFAQRVHTVSSLQPRAEKLPRSEDFQEYQTPHPVRESSRRMERRRVAGHAASSPERKSEQDQSTGNTRTNLIIIVVFFLIYFVLKSCT